MPAVHLDDRALISLTGPDARAFLQGLVTNDIDKVSSEEMIYAALLTPQGKILFDFFVVEFGGAILIDCAKSSRDALAKRLSLYKLRSKVTIEAFDEMAVVASWDGTRTLEATLFPDPRAASFGLRGFTNDTSLGQDGASAYREHRLALGFPESSDFGSDRMFALDADLDELHAISFDKGCYVGQELTARMKHRSTARKRLLPVESVGAPLPAGDTSVTANGQDIGELISAYGSKGFALLRLDRLADARDAPIKIGSNVLKVDKPRWLFP